MIAAGWCLWFAWYPVWVDAYSVDQIINGQMRYRRWLQTVEYRLAEWTDEEGEKHAVYKYRLHKEETTK